MRSKATFLEIDISIQIIELAMKCLIVCVPLAKQQLNEFQ